jgi:hypothetical protein
MRNDSAQGAAAAFLTAIDQGEANAVWECFSTGARQFVIDRGIRRGLSPVAGASILDGTASPHFRDQFLEDLLAGLRRDLELVRLPLVEIGTVSPLDDRRVRVIYLERFDVPLGPPLEPLPVGSVELVEEDGGWRVERLIPRPGG